MRQIFREKRIPQKEIFIRADLDDRYGYKLISGEKQPQRRDTILRICLAAEFTLGETQEALILYGMAPLYEKLRRDTAFIVAFCTSVVPYTTPTPRPTPKPTPTPMPSVPYVGMYVSYVPSKWTWQGTDNLTVKDAAGNGIRTIKYRYDAPPKIYVIWVSESTNKVVKVSVTDPTASSNRKSTTNKKSSSDPYQAKDYAHPDDFYYDYRDDFWDYEDAEDYWEKHH